MGNHRLNRTVDAPSLVPGTNWTQGRRRTEEFRVGFSAHHPFGEPDDGHDEMLWSNYDRNRYGSD